MSVGKVLRILRERFAPDAIDGISQNMAKFTYLKRADQNMIRQKAEARVLLGSGFPDEFVSEMRTKNASLSKNKKTLVLVWSTHRSSLFQKSL